jgi:hypothetical protein
LAQSLQWEALEQRDQASLTDHGNFNPGAIHHSASVRRVDDFELPRFTVQGAKLLPNSDLITVYRNTDYRVDAAPKVTLRIDLHDPDIDACLDAHHVETAAFLTAFNPLSRPTSDAENACAQESLVRDLATLGIAHIAGRGIGRDGTWPPEPSVLALSISCIAAEELARTYRQNAFVWVERGKAPELVLTSGLR